MSDTLTPEDRRRLEELFDRAFDLPPAEHAAFLERECKRNDALRRELARLLAGLAGEDLVSRVELVLPPQPGARTGTRIGPYELQEKIGDGGMGEVYAAEQGGPVPRRVAVKVIKPGMDSAHVLARFDAERQALARMTHPNVAHVYDGGATDDGRPYFAMELVAGLSITAHCDRHKLSTRARIELFLGVCDGVRHAHQKGIIHRDLKPSNLLVATVDGRAVPKIIDFGVARAMTGSLAERTLFTTLGQIVGTLDYMSPEQADPSSVDVDTRSDVYSLGVVLYQLVSGLLPFEHASAVDRPLSEMQRAIREDEPPTPSTRLRRRTGTATTVAPLHGTDGRALIRQLAGDLDWICLKALSKDPARRYQSAAELADDLHRHLAHEPVRAGRPGALYRARKFARRHRVALTAGLAVAAALSVGAFGVVAGRLEAAAKGDELRKLADAKKLEQLVAEADLLWPPYPDAGRIDAMEAWVGRAEALAANLADHRRALAALRERALPEESVDLEAADVADAADVPRARRFASYEDQWQHDALRELVVGLELLANELLDTGARTADTPVGAHGWSVPQRISYARSVVADYAPGGPLAAAWDEALPRIRRARADLDGDGALEPAYPDLDLSQQVGLLPLGPDPVSGLWEFAELLTGTPPVRDADGRFLLNGKTGLVLVLIPAGTFWMGAQQDDEEGRNYDPAAMPFEAPAHAVTIAEPFFLSKFEMTQGQWARFTGRRPSRAGSRKILTDDRPVNGVSWRECDAVTHQLGLALPTEEQWEYAARAGTDTPFWTGWDESSLQGKVNLLDKRTATKRPFWARTSTPADWDDDDIAPAPIGKYAANGFGLHGTAGNVSEWTASRVRRYSDDPGVEPPPQAPYLSRGGNHQNGPYSARSSFREWANGPDFAWAAGGLRPARPVVP